MCTRQSSNVDDRMKLSVPIMIKKFGNLFQIVINNL